MSSAVSGEAVDAGGENRSVFIKFFDWFKRGGCKSVANASDAEGWR